MEQSAPKRRRIKFKRWGITQKKEYNIQNTAKVWNQERDVVMVIPIRWNGVNIFLQYYGKRFASLNIRVCAATSHLSRHYQKSPTFQCITNKRPTLRSQESNATSNSSTWKYQSTKMLPTPRLVH